MKLGRFVKFLAFSDEIVSKSARCKHDKKSEFLPSILGVWITKCENCGKIWVKEPVFYKCDKKIISNDFSEEFNDFLTSEQSKIN